MLQGRDRYAALANLRIYRFTRELVKRAIKFQNPPRVPYNFDSNRTPDNGEKYGEDMLWVFLSGKDSIVTADGKIDEWGCLWETMSASFGEPKVFPLEGKEDLSSFKIPDFTEPWRYVKLKKEIEDNKREKYVLAMLPHGLFQHMLHLFGFMDFMLNMGCNQELIEELCSKLCDSAIKVVDIMADCGVDGIITIDDTALQDRPMISMNSFNQIFKPYFKKLYNACRLRGLDTFMHSCGYTIDIIEELIEVGLDVINLDQQDNMGISKLSQRYKGRICFYCPLDIQTTLLMKEDEIAHRVKEMVEAFATEKGGFIAKTYPQPTAIEASDEYMHIMCEEFKKY